MTFPEFIDDGIPLTFFFYPERNGAIMDSVNTR